MRWIALGSCGGSNCRLNMPRCQTGLGAVQYKRQKEKPAKPDPGKPTHAGKLAHREGRLQATASFSRGQENLASFFLFLRSFFLIVAAEIIS